MSLQRCSILCSIEKLCHWGSLQSCSILCPSAKLDSMLRCQETSWWMRKFNHLRMTNASSAHRPWISGQIEGVKAMVSRDLSPVRWGADTALGNHIPRICLAWGKEIADQASISGLGPWCIIGKGKFCKKICDSKIELPRYFKYACLPLACLHMTHTRHCRHILFGKIHQIMGPSTSQNGTRDV